MSQYTIMIVLSDRLQAKNFATWLETAGMKVLLAYRGETAYQMILDREPDLVIIDWSLPDLSGLAITRRIRSETRLSDIPVVMVGDQMNETNRIMALEAGVDLCLAEVGHSAIFVARIRAVLRRSLACHDATWLVPSLAHIDR